MRTPLEMLSLELDTLSDVAYTNWRAISDEFGAIHTTGAQYDFANRLYDLSERLKAAVERESKGVAA